MNPAAPAPNPAPAPSPVVAKKRKWKKFLFFGIPILVAILVGVSWYRSKHAEKNYGVTTEKAVVRTVTQVVTATGKIQPEIEVKISPEVYGEIIELPFREGARVKKGALIVRIKPDLYQAQVDQQTAAVASARATARDAHAKVGEGRVRHGAVRGSLPAQARLRVGLRDLQDQPGRGQGRRACRPGQRAGGGGAPGPGPRRPVEDGHLRADGRNRELALHARLESASSRRDSSPGRRSCGSPT